MTRPEAHGSPGEIAGTDLRVAVLSRYPQHREAIARGAECWRCPLLNSGRGPVLGDVVRNAPVAYVGEAPGPHEVVTGRVFVGVSGIVLDRAVLTGGLTRSDVTIINTQGCQPPEGMALKQYEDRLNRVHKAVAKKAEAAGEPPPPPPVLPRDACAPMLRRGLIESNSRVVCAVGGAALEQLARIFNVGFARRKAPPGAPVNEFGRPLRVVTIKKQHGAPFLLPDGRVLCSSLHPAFAMRGAEQRYRPVIAADLARAATIATRGGRIDWVEPKSLLDPSVDEAVGFIWALRESGARVTLDLETDGKDPLKARIRCVGLGAVIGGHERVGVIPLRHIDGRPWYDDVSTRRIAAELRALFQSAPLAGHNIIPFDLLVLLTRKLIMDRSRIGFDTLLADHDTDRSELPHDLGFVTSREFEAPRWKEDADAKYVEHVTDAELHAYCAKDVLWSMRLVPRLRDRVVNTGMVEPYKIDIELARIGRDMTTLGLHVDIDKRKSIYDRVIADMRVRLVTLRRIVGHDDFNPASTKQVADYLFGTKGLVPPLTPQGEEWEEGDTASTSETALVRLLTMGVDDATGEFINALLEYRGRGKIVGTYLNGPARVAGAEEDESEEEDDLPALLPFPTETIEGAAYPIFHVAWRAHIVPTGRLSSSPNAQNWSSSPINLREMIIAPPGHVFVGADFEQIELRLYAVLAQDSLLLDAFKSGSDPHAWNFACMLAGNDFDRARQLYKQMQAAGGKNNAKVKHLRYTAKRFVFLIIYGGEPGTLYATMSTERNTDGSLTFPNIKPSDVQRWYDGWHAAHPETRRWQTRVRRGWREFGSVATILSRRKRFFIGGFDRNAIVNHPIQGGAADIMNRGFIAVSNLIPYCRWSPFTGPVLQVHDFGGWCVPAARADEALAIIKREMPFSFEGMEFPVDAHVATNWGAL